MVMLMVLAQLLQCAGVNRLKPSATAQIALTLAPREALLTALLCNANPHFHMSSPITSSPCTLVFMSLPWGAPRSVPLLQPGLTLAPSAQRREALKQRPAWLTCWQPWWRAATGYFHWCLLSLTLLSLPCSHVHCISLGLIFADKCWLSCCAAPYSLWTLHQRVAGSALQMSSLWLHSNCAILDGHRHRTQTGSF